MKSFGWVATTVALIAILLFTEVEQIFFPKDFGFFDNLAIEEFLFLGIASFVLLSKLLYVTLYRRNFKITLQNHLIVISRGVFLHSHTSIPLSKVTQVNIARDLIHFLFGLRYLEVLLPGQMGNIGETKSIRLEGLFRKDAALLCDSIQKFFPESALSHVLDVGLPFAHTDTSSMISY